MTPVPHLSRSAVVPKVWSISDGTHVAAVELLEVIDDVKNRLR
jgi:hypothetical protein